jgi:hypothetical protein
VAERRGPTIAALAEGVVSVEFCYDSRRAVFELGGVAMLRQFHCALACGLGFAVGCCGSAHAADDLAGDVHAAITKAVLFYSGEVARHGGYVYRYSADLTKSEGESRTGPDTVWVQPPGTPAVGMACLQAYERTGNEVCLRAAQAAAECLLQGQLQSGGWQDRIEFAPEDRAKLAYRTNPRIHSRAKNNSTFDDNKTQSALSFLIRFDRAVRFQHAAVHEAVGYALDAIVKAQRPNGGWPQVWTGPADPREFPARPAAVPAEWPREFPGGDYWHHYTLNDNALVDTLDVLWLAADVYRDERWRQAAIRGGEFLLAAQLPEPQPAWAQQYDRDMHPAWARKFEPPAVSGGESQGVIAALLRLYVETEDARFLQPIPRALDYLTRSQLPNGKLARFYELQTNRPLYFTRAYELTYDDNDLPTHYSFQVPSRVDRLRRDYERLAKLSADGLAKERARFRESKAQRPKDEEVRAILARMDERGAWVEEGRLQEHGKNDGTTRIIDSRTFIRHLDILSRYVDRSHD